MKLDVIKPWITTKITQLLGMEDDVVVEFVYNQLEEKVRQQLYRRTTFVYDFFSFIYLSIFFTFFYILQQCFVGRIDLLVGNKKQFRVRDMR